jgi:hypothetical protein
MHAHRDQCEGFLGKKISLPSGILHRRAAIGGIPQGELILSLGPPPHKPLKRSYFYIFVILQILLILSKDSPRTL